MNFSFSRFAAAILLCVVIVVLLRMLGILRGEHVTAHQHPERPADSIRPLRLVLSAPAFLVPATMALLLAVSTFHLDMAAGSLKIAGALLPWDDPWHLLLFCGDSVLLAGLCGLFRARYLGQPTSSAAFLQGIRRHTIAIFLGRLLLSGGVALVASTVVPDVTWQAILFVVPNLLLAPLLGASALHPGRPLQAIRATLHDSTSNVSRVGKLVTLQVLFALVLWVLFWQVRAGFTHVDGLKAGIASITMLATSTSVVSFNVLPMLDVSARTTIGFDLALIATDVIGSTAFLAAHFLRVMDAATADVEQPLTPASPAA